MRKLSTKLNKLLIATCFIFFNQFVNAQWQQTNGPTGSWIHCIVQHDSVALCGTLQGMYFSSDSGNTWNNYPLFQNKNIQSIYAKGDTLILLYNSGYTEYDYFDSTFSVTSFDNGNTWTTPLFLSSFGYVPTTLHSCPGKIIASDLYMGPFVTYDFGLSWTPIILPFGEFTDLEFSGNYMLLITSDPGFTVNYFYLSRIDSINFIQVDTNNYGSGITIVDSVIFGCHISTPGQYDIIKSVDLGQTWNTIATADWSFRAN